jgi:acyl transferase domain-containing protein
LGVSLGEAERIDPQQRILLEVAFEAIGDAGQPLEDLAESRTGVIKAVWTADHENIMYANTCDSDLYLPSGREDGIQQPVVFPITLISRLPV